VSILKPVLILAVLVSPMLANSAWAVDPPPRVGSTPDAPKPQPQPQPQPSVTEPRSKPDASPDPAPQPGAKAVPRKNAQTSPKKPLRQPIKRRSVHQNIDPVPRINSPMVYGPVLTPAAPVGVQPIPMPVPGSPVILNNCNGGACTDAAGARYRGGVGNVLISPEGRAWSNNGITVQCF
jgi:hypothetical protein